MRILVVLQHVGLFRNIEPVVRELDRCGHELVLLHGNAVRTWNPAKRDSDYVRAKDEVWRLVCRAIDQGMEDFPEMALGYRPSPAEPWRTRLLTAREVVNRALYSQKGHPSPDHRGVEVLEELLPPRVRRVVRSRAGRAMLGRRLTLRAWRLLERLLPPSPTVRRLLRELDPDVLVVSPAVWAVRPVETDYVRAARSLGIPSVGYVSSWDNLTSKGTLHVVPDVFVVWNEPLADEAVAIHAIPRKAIAVTGAPYLDPVFALRQSGTRAEVCAGMGCPGDRPYVLYLCTSRTLIGSEVDVVNDLAAAFAGRFGSAAPTIVVRPHPMNPYAWDGYSRPGVVVHPRLGGAAATPDSWQDYYDQLSAATCVVGLNTTAFLEAVVANRPCLTIVGEKFYATHEQTGHFRHLIGANFLEVAGSTEEVAERVARILEGADEKADGRRAFAEWFLRPRGLDTPVAPGVADLIEGLASPREAGAERRRAPAAGLLSARTVRRRPELVGARVTAVRTPDGDGGDDCTALVLVLDDGRSLRIRAAYDRFSRRACFTVDLQAPKKRTKTKAKAKKRQPAKQRLAERARRAPAPSPLAEALLEAAPAGHGDADAAVVVGARIAGAAGSGYGLGDDQTAFALAFDDGRGLAVRAAYDEAAQAPRLVVDVVDGAGVARPQRVAHAV